LEELFIYEMEQFCETIYVGHVGKEDEGFDDAVDSGSNVSSSIIKFAKLKILHDGYEYEASTI
jgi:hypothetical protein